MLKHDNSPGRSGQGESQPDLRRFWHAHDQALGEHRQRGTVFSHDLYRGMPEWFNQYFAHFQRRAVSGLLRKCEFPSQVHALDIGCGTGRWTGLLLGKGMRVCGVDLGEQAIQYAAGRWCAADFVVGELPCLSFARDSFDLALSVTVLQHIPHAQQLDAIRSVTSVLSPGGYLLACETTDAGDPSEHIFGNLTNVWLALFGQAGLELASQSACEFLPHIKLFHWLRKMWKTSRPQAAGADVSSVARFLDNNRLAAMLVRLAITASYPFEYVASVVLPRSWARLRCFLLRKPPCVSA